MKKLILLGLVLFQTNFLFSQLNMTLKSQIEYNETLNDVWGYAAPDGREYAFVGARNGVSICLLYTSPSPRDATLSRMPSSA